MSDTIVKKVENEETLINLGAVEEKDLSSTMKPIPNMGSHLILDFANTDVDLDNLEAIETKLEEVCKCSAVTIEGKTSKKFEPQGVTICFLLSESHLSIHTWPENRSCAIDFYHCGEKAIDNLTTAEEMICDWLGWENCTQRLRINRGQRTAYLCNDFPEKGEIFNNVKFVHREKTPFQEIRIYDTNLKEGRIMAIDDAVQFSKNVTDHPEKDNYTVDLSKVCDKNTDYEHVVIIGGGDLIVARYLCENFTKIKKITVCEIDNRVIECTKKYFGVGDSIDKWVEEGKLEIVVNGGAEYMADLVKSGLENSIGAFIVDCTDFVCYDVIEGAPSAELFTPEFYGAVHKLMKPGAYMSQQISHDSFRQGFIDRNTGGGFKKENITFIRSEVPEYGGPGYLPLAMSMKEY